MGKHLVRTATALAALVLGTTPAWAHPSSTPHFHGGEISLLLVMAAGLGGLWLLRRRTSRAG
jgi:MYXO-CTERM domain-containing protein